MSVVIESGDITRDFSNTDSTAPPCDVPAYVSGDLIIMFFGCDDDLASNATFSHPSTGRNGETLILSSYGSGGSSSTGPTQGVAAWVGDATVAAGNWVWSLGGVGEQWASECIKVPAGEFDATTPIGAVSGYSGNTSASGTTIATPAITAGSTDGGGKYIVHIVTDADPISGSPTGWSTIVNSDRGAIASAIVQRDADVTDSESIASVNYTISSDSSSTKGLIIRAPAATGETATGAPSIILPTSSGTAKRTLKGSGAPSIILPTSTGAAKLVLHATGAPSIILPTSAGTAQLTIHATGAPALPLITSAGAATISTGKTATGAPSIILPTASGAATVTRHATGAPEIILPTSSGTATVQGVKTATGAPSIILPTSSGTAKQTLKASGSPSIILPTSSGEAGQTLHASGSPSIPLVESAGQATISGAITATGAPSIILPTSSGQAKLTNKASGTVSIILPTSSGAAKQTLKSTGSPSIILPTSAGTSGQTLHATGSPSIILPTSAGTAAIQGQITATGDPSITLPTAAGQAKQTLHATGSPSLPLIESAGQAAIAGSITATGEPVLPLITAQGSATVGSVVVSADVSAGGRVKRKRRYLIEIDGQWFDADNIPQVRDVLSQAAEIAQESADEDVRRGQNIRIKPPVIRVKTVSGDALSDTIQREVKKTQQVIADIYLKAYQEIEQIREISRLMHKRMDEEEEEEAIMLLLL